MKGLFRAVIPPGEHGSLRVLRQIGPGTWHDREVDRVSGRGGARVGIQRFVTVDEYRLLLGVGRSTVFQWIKEGKLVEGVHYVRMGKRVLRFPHPQALEAPLAQVPLSGRKPRGKSEPVSSSRRGRSPINLDWGT